jgi:hypothetical protein
MKMSIYYMHYNTKEEQSRSRDPNKSRPAWFSYVNCFNNLINTLNHDVDWEIELVVWFDGKVEDAQDFLKKCEIRLRPGISILTLCSEFGSQRASSDQMIPYMLNQGYSDDRMIYILENDYIHKIDWLFHVKCLIETGVNFDHLTLADHPDNYTHTSNYRTQLLASSSHVWKTTFYSCWSNLFKYRSLKHEAVNLLKYNDRAFFADAAARGRYLLAPVPALSTHSMIGQLSPAVDWEKVVFGQ